MKHLGYGELPFAELRAFPGNPRRGDLATISRSLLRFGQYRSVVVWRVPLSDGGLDENVVVAGNHTTAAALRLASLSAGEIVETYGERYAEAAEAWSGRESIRVELIECGGGWDEARRINAADNRLAELGGYDEAALDEMLAGFGDDFEATGWAVEDLAALREEPGRDVGFRAFDEDIPVDHVCPSCGYAWSGSPAPRAAAVPGGGSPAVEPPPGSSAWDGS